MNIRKQYTKPYCTLVLDGFDENADILEENTEIQESCISILTNAECHFAVSNQRLSGGRSFLENLSSAVNSYAQECLSGLSHPQDERAEYPQIKITPTDTVGMHNLTLEPDPQEGESRQEITIKTLELFDLVEVIDRFYADTTALPDVNAELEIVSKRFRQPDEPMAQRVIPLVTGTISLAIAAGLFFVLPVPQTPEIEPETNVPVVPTTPAEDTDTLPIEAEETEETEE